MKTMRKSMFWNWFAGVALATGLWMVPQGVQADVYLGLDGGLEGSATVDDTVQSAAQAGKWTKNNATQTIAEETTVVRSGGKSIRMFNSATTARRTWTPLVTFGSKTTGVTIQYYRLITNSASCQTNQVGVIRASESLQGTYSKPTAIDTWEKATYSPSSATFTSLAGVIMHRASSTGAGNMFVDDLCVYDGSVDTTAPNSAGAVTIATNAASSLDVSWEAASGGVDSGGYLVVRYASSPAAGDDPNVNGIYATNNTIAGTVTGTVVYQGDGTSFTDSGLTSGQTYYYKVYSYDKAYNYASETTGSGMAVEYITFHAKVPGWADHNPGNPAIWGPNPGPGWSGYTMTLNGSWWEVTVPVADASAAVTYQLRFAQTGTWKYQKASGSVPPAGDETYTTTSGHIWIDSTSPDNWNGDDFSLAASKTTLVVLSLLSARNESGQVVIRWETSSEENTVGFFVERWDGSAWVRVNDQIVYASGQDGMGSSYAVVDAGAAVDEVYSYRLVEVETGGSEEMYGPYDLSTGFSFRRPVEFNANGSASIHWLSRQGETYTVLRSTDLTKGREGFRVLRAGIAATPPENTYIDDDAPGMGVYSVTADRE